jgi:BirA family biotin operon repressor/biotin-[acetyl-CoA-carboxylase] ligase
MIGHPRVHYRLTDSTNERARALAAAGAAHGTLVTADEQSAGRGRQGRVWTAPPKSAVLMSVVLREVSETLPLAAAVAVCEACECEAGVGCSIKWPNDVWINEKKVAGILVEGRPQEGWAVLGIGLNVWIGTDDFPPELRDTATSLLIEYAAPEVETMVEEIVSHLDAWLPANPAEVLAEWRKRDVLLGKPVRWENGHKAGTAAGIDSTGALLVDTEAGQVTLDAGEVHLER